MKEKLIGKVGWLAISLVLSIGCNTASTGNSRSITGIPHEMNSTKSGANTIDKDRLSILYSEEELEYKRRFTEMSGRALEVEKQGDQAAKANDFTGAERFYKSAIEISPKFEGSDTILSGAPKKLALLYIDKGRWQDAVFAIVGQLKHGDPGVCNPILGIAYAELGDAVAAKRTAPENPGAENGSAYDHVDYKTGAFDQERNLPPPATSLTGWKAASYFSVGLTQSAIEPLENRRSVTYFQKAAEAMPEVPLYTYHYMVALQENGYLDSALEWADKCLLHAKGALLISVKAQRYDIDNYIKMNVAWNKGRKPD